MVCLFGILVIPNTFSENETDNQWGTIFIEKSVLEIPYTPWGNTDYEKIKIFGTVVEPRSATWAYLTITEPDGKTSEVTAIASSDGTYESYILICCNKLGKYTVSAEWKGHYLGIVEFDVVQKSRSIVISPIVVIETTKPSYKTGDNIFIVGMSRTQFQMKISNCSLQTQMVRKFGLTNLFHQAQEISLHGRVQAKLEYRVELIP